LGVCAWLFLILKRKPSVFFQGPVIPLSSAGCPFYDAGREQVFFQFSINHDHLFSIAETGKATCHSPKFFKKINRCPLAGATKDLTPNPTNTRIPGSI
jgi:hypothetical protein